jgi:hypothetical protein
MAVWDTRRVSLKMISQDESWSADFIARLFEILDTLIDRFQAIKTPYSQTCGLLALKGRNLCLILFDAIIDGLSHVSTGLVSQIMEMNIWMDYLLSNPANAIELSASGFPNSGDLFNKIQCELNIQKKEFIEYKATEFGFTKKSLYFPLDKKNKPWVKTQVHKNLDLIIQLGLVVVLLLWLIRKCSECLKVENCIDEKLDEEVRSLNRRSMEYFFFL